MKPLLITSLLIVTVGSSAYLAFAKLHATRRNIVILGMTSRSDSVTAVLQAMGSDVVGMGAVRGAEAGVRLEK